MLAAADGWTNTEIAEELGVSRPTVGKWRRGFVEMGLDGLVDAPRSGAPRKVVDQEIEHVIAMTLGGTPPNATHWSTRSMAEATGLSQSTISRIWRAFSLQPHRVETFKLSSDPLFVSKVRDIVGLSMDPPDRPLCCASTRRARHRPWSGRSRCFRCGPASPSGEPMTPCVTGRRRSSQRWTPRPARSSAGATGATEPRSSSSSFG